MESISSTKYSQTTDIFTLYANEVGMQETLTHEYLCQLSHKARAGCKKSANKIVTANLKLVIAIAKTYMYCGLSSSDLVQEGNIGLMRAVEKFDPDLGFRFSTYATWWIKSYIQIGIMKQNSTIRLPRHIHAIVNKSKKEKNLFDEEVINILNSEMEKNIMLQKSNNFISSDNLSDSDLIENNFVDNNHFHKIENEILLEQVIKSARLKEVEFEVLCRSYGIFGFTDDSQTEIAEFLNTTTSNVKWHKSSALKKLKKKVRILQLKN